MNGEKKRSLIFLAVGFVLYLILLLLGPSYQPFNAEIEDFKYSMFSSSYTRVLSTDFLFLGTAELIQAITWIKLQFYPTGKFIWFVATVCALFTIQALLKQLLINGRDFLDPDDDDDVPFYISYPVDYVWDNILLYLSSVFACKLFSPIYDALTKASRFYNLLGIVILAILAVIILTPSIPTLLYLGGNLFILSILNRLTIGVEIATAAWPESRSRLLVLAIVVVVVIALNIISSKLLEEGQVMSLGWAAGVAGPAFSVIGGAVAVFFILLLVFNVPRILRGEWHPDLSKPIEINEDYLNQFNERERERIEKEEENRIKKRQKAEEKQRQKEEEARLEAERLEELKQQKRAEKEIENIIKNQFKKH